MPAALVGLFTLTPHVDVDAFSPLQTTARVPVVRVAQLQSKTIRYATVPEQEEQVQEEPAAVTTNGLTESDPTAAAFNKLTVYDGIPYEDMTIGVLKEDMAGENRVSQTPDTVRNLVKAGFKVVVEKGGKYLILQ